MRELRGVDLLLLLMRFANFLKARRSSRTKLVKHLRGLFKILMLFPKHRQMQEKYSLEWCSRFQRTIQLFLKSEALWRNRAQAVSRLWQRLGTSKKLQLQFSQVQTQ